MEEKLKNTEPGAQTPGENAAAAGQENTGAQKPSWEQILSDPDYRACYDAAVQGIVQRRLRNSRNAQEQLRKLEPLLRALALRYRVDTRPEAIDAVALAALIVAELERAERGSEKVFCHLEKLLEQEEQLREIAPGFEIFAALEDGDFLRLTAPHTGLSLVQAWYALHRDEVEKQAARQSLEKLSRSIRSGAGRPRELGGGREGQSFSPDPRSMTKAQRQALKKRIYDAAARNEKLYA